MGQYVLTGGATGIGAAIKQKLEQLGHACFVVDIKDADLVADLSRVEQRQTAIDEIKAQFPDGIDGFIPCAGVGPNVKPYSLIAKINYFGSVELVEGLSGLLEKKQGAVVMVSSNSASMPGTNQDYINHLLANDEQKACDLIDTLDGHNAYAGSKQAIARWMRKQSTDYAQKGIRINAVAPGIVKTPLTDGVMEDKQLGALMKDFGDTVPVGRLGTPADIANLVWFLLSPEAQYVQGSVFFVDGGHDAMLRPDDF